MANDEQGEDRSCLAESSGPQSNPDLWSLLRTTPPLGISTMDWFCPAKTGENYYLLFKAVQLLNPPAETVTCNKRMNFSTRRKEQNDQRRQNGQSHSIIWGVFFCLLFFSFTTQNIINIWKHWIFSVCSLEVKKWEGKVCEHFTASLLFILGKMSDVQNTSEGFVHKPHVDNYAALQWDDCIWEIPPFRENVSGLGFLQDEWDQTKGFLKGT